VASASTLHSETDTYVHVNAIACQYDLRNDVRIQLRPAVRADASGDLSSVAWPPVNGVGRSFFL